MRCSSLLPALALALAACAPAAGGPATPPGGPPAASSPGAAAASPVAPAGSPAPASPAAAPASGATVTVPPAAQPVVEAARQDAATRLGVPAAQIQVERLEAREWPDTGLGCPQPGMMYAQVITPGYLVVLSGAGKRLEYHADARARAVFCREL